jgi:tetratricopeptide (TPR) repeat protein
MRALLAAALSLTLAAQARAAFLDLGAGARAPGLGDAFTALADDAYAIHYNPAGLAQLERPELAAAYSRLYLGLSDNSDLGSSQIVYAQPLAHGKEGVLGIGWERFSLSGLYTEQTITASYGRRFWSGDNGAQFMAGVNAKYLTHSFAPGPEATSSCNAGFCGGGPDPVLTGPTSKSVPDADIGFIYRFPRRFQLGLSVLNVTQPNVAFAGTDPLQREINLGLAYKSVWLSLLGELKMVPAATGGTDRDVVVAAERYFPTLDYGQFGLRGSIGFSMNDSNYRQMTVGASYRINELQFDYAYIIPVGGVEGQSGSQRVSLSFRFGAPSGGEEISKELLEQARHLRQGVVASNNPEARPQEVSNPLLADVRRLIEERQYRMAKKALADYAAKKPLTQGLIRLSNRLDLVVDHYAELPEPKDKFDHALVDSLHRFFDGQDRLAMLETSYAFSLKPEDAQLEALLDDMEKTVKIKATRLPADHPRGFIEEMLYQAEYANTRGEMEKVETLLADTLVLDPQNTTALERLGSLRYLAGRLPEAIAAWEAAAKIETRERELVSLREYLRVARSRAGSGAVVAQPPVAPTAPSNIEAATTPPSTANVEPATPSVPAGPAGDPRDIENLYQRGVEHYARGEYLQASAMFLRILQIDPDNEQARKALERIESRRSRQ